ncbi:helix-turn-helix domain-containing protein [Sphingomonas sp. ABOLD]|nr:MULTISPECIES: helix-turn-helix transcriptional regulator [Sphingomonas]RSV44320.1 helix-turn-helix domain-containing protein [Sphingomonas sp. ABOLE]RSV51972.1 helix-turn-helix domain-containing protein [Sphingomonas sp. ABOLD]
MKQMMLPENGAGTWPECWIVAAVALRDRREALGWSLEQLADRTCIGRNHLIALESARFDCCGAPIYAIGFARAAARAMALEEAPILVAIRDGHAARRPVPAPPVAATRRRRIPNLGIASTAARLGALLSDGRG